VKVVVQNQGTAAAAAPFTARAFFSSDPSLDPGDTLLKTWNIGALAPAATAVVKTRNTLPPAAGYILVVVDQDGVIDETDETNNQTGRSL